MLSIFPWVPLQLIEQKGREVSSSVPLNCVKNMHFVLAELQFGRMSFNCQECYFLNCFLFFKIVVRPIVGGEVIVMIISMT